MAAMKAGVLGTGDVGRVLAGGLAGLGHAVTLGSRDAGKAREVAAKAGSGVQGGTFADAVKGADLVVLATSWAGAENALKLAGGPAAFAGKVVMDATNPLDLSQGPPPKLNPAGTDSAGERVQRWLPGAKVVKAFNMVGNAHMVKPQFPGGPPDMLVAGNDEGAKKAVTEVARGLGWSVVDLGGIESARWLEALAMAWILYGFKTNTWNHAWKLLRK
ncbi:MAG TPA: NAD(P)-binding domain-containing protein [Anaeromyxobacteraceae bacterium]|nr:NAD(P)-binding domain-containing protein [Anaeromyxobacteraceae bacterium]